MPKKNYYTYKYSRKVLNDKPNEPDIDNGNSRNKYTCAVPNSCQTKSIIYQANIDCL